jgi:hypothetical protein
VGRGDGKTDNRWEHVDQGSEKRGPRCFQMVLNLLSNGPKDGGLWVIPGSHKIHDRFFTETGIKTKGDWFAFMPKMLKTTAVREANEKQFRKFYGHLKPIKICLEPGDAVVWDSRTVHWGSKPELENALRFAQYICMTPASLTSKRVLNKRIKLFKALETTSHCPFDPTRFKPEPGVDKKDKNREAKVKRFAAMMKIANERPPPKLSKRGLQLVGIEPYEKVLVFVPPLPFNGHLSPLQRPVQPSQSPQEKEEDAFDDKQDSTSMGMEEDADD